MVGTGGGASALAHRSPALTSKAPTPPFPSSQVMMDSLRQDTIPPFGIIYGALGLNKEPTLLEAAMICPQNIFLNIWYTDPVFN